ncbi:hypothetical protein A3D00_00395 [Candidatus Woesebacteria bacterium RIFCSPHIGHO2_02_FULL_38_9]|uniref:NAD-dependent epimerase/dehydratase domain-containing protein n=1 Tax=Candidatus Woesebacteria bacterium RIFCSPHIGHO2_01_FULL_39_28 TaxID=1802496 RepID=A0A1F7YK25_9BACT|nr:MAG: hypothetical protein A2627_04650 [Candidatus Woesebacteria bacterium RIFCSPHIGHO2_01_FULL_39_28]OGM33192.1 MAG: hypothetical protein A3D00_00395 [Candidatus Woesebacteria bacterium RIFCSPHIGHO2_02_FULL_38_9]OGM57080.1 MAG: hypothetical protein A3A50_05455 [Candidatus Woesebacteria bacterium RIFCSPLOWO2_01_FULL_38_20]
MSKKVVVIGGAGNVGQGITKAFKKHNWIVKVIDPQINTTFEELDDLELKKFFSIKHIIYVAEIGNRDLYADHPNLAKQNNIRFKNFCKKISQINPKAIIWYIGGSWTKRKSNKNWLITDKSPNKDLKDCNPYEKAKISAENNAKRLSKFVKIRFLDWASIVPNFSENFTIPKMVKQALSQGKIIYSPGPYGRPLLETTQAGEALILLIEHDSYKKQFNKFLLPGLFVSFTEFAQSVKNVIEEKTNKIIRLEKQSVTPNFLKSKTSSSHLEKLGFKPSKKTVLNALEKNAFLYLRELI